MIVFHGCLHCRRKDGAVEICMDRRKIRVLHISKYYHPFSGGTEQVARECVMALQESEKHLYEQVVFCFDHKGMKGARPGNHRSMDSVERIDGIRVVRCACQVKVASQSLSFSYRRRLKAVFDQFRPDIVVFHYPNPFAAAYLLSFLKQEQKLIVFWHLDIVKQKILGKLFSRQNHRLLRRADRVIATSPNYLKGSPWLQGYTQKCAVIPNCIDESKFEKSDPEEVSAEGRIRKRFAGRILCLAVGRHVAYKGFHYLIEAARYLDENYAVVITGEGGLTETLKGQAEALGEQAKLQGHGAKLPEIVFAGLISDAELHAYLHACDIFCFPSITKNEAFGIALAEAMYCGKPAVTFTIEGSGVNYVNLNGVTGIECPNRDSRSYAEAIRFLAEDPARRRQYGDAARRRVEENFMFRQFSERIRALFSDVAGNP